MRSGRDICRQILGKHDHPKQLAYGTAGFRGDASCLEEALLRCGILAACRSHALNGDAVGAMITASHNPPGDNGVKLVEPDGSMLDAAWESVATSFINADNHQNQPNWRGCPTDLLLSLVDVDDVVKKQNAVVIVGRDTRISSSPLSNLLIEGVEAVGGKVIYVKEVTTPQLHVAVREYNQNGKVNLDNYFNILSDAFERLVGDSGVNHSLTKQLIIDCANGVGSFSVDRIKHLLPGIKIVNANGDGPLNESCGADYVQKKRVTPKVYKTEVQGDTWASLDGDADRLVFFQPKEDDTGVALADGDRFAAIVAKFITEQIKQAGIAPLSIAVAQTAYSNGAATDYLAAMEGVEIVVTNTGVKYLEKAVKQYDIGIYWEPNGHGTVLFNKQSIQILKEAYEQVKNDKSTHNRVRSLASLLALSRLANQAVGDGVADLLVIIAILSRTNMSFDDWLRLYSERSSCNMIVHVMDKSVISTTDFDRQVEKPAALQRAIVEICNVNGCRGFVRPSGTEDVVRVYAEAPNEKHEQAEEMAVAISRAVYDCCGGIGERM